MTPFDYAKLELGTAEVLGKASNPRIDQYLSTTSLPEGMIEDSTPWCSAFVNWCHVMAGIEGTNRANARSWLEWGEEVKWPPQVGDVTELWRNSQKGSKGHVGFYVREDKNRVFLLGGNQNNKVCIAPYPKVRIMGYRRFG